VRGRDGWLFLTAELRSLAAGRFWEQRGQGEESRIVGDVGPLRAILDFKDQLALAGIELIFVPIPAKALIYPELASAELAIAPGEPPPRLDPHVQEFLAVLQDNAVETIDLLPHFLERRRSAETALFLERNTHWSGAGCRLAAEAIAASVRRREWIASLAREPFTTDERMVSVPSDLDPSWPPEETRVRFVTRGEEPRSGVAAARTSPIVLIGDSYARIYHPAPGAPGGGLSDQLAAELGLPVDLVGSEGQGATGARLALLRRGDSLAGKKLVIWCLAGRSFTGGEGWQLVPLRAPARDAR
jgi:hypothetical protein